METVEYKTKKVPAQVDELLHEFQAKYTLKSGERITEGRAIEACVRHGLEHLEAIVGKRRKKRHTFQDLKGFIKGGAPSNAEEEIDRVVYGV